MAWVKVPGHAQAVLEPFRPVTSLDTNVLLHDPTSLFRFEEHDVYLPMITLEELDNHKKGMPPRSRATRARSARFLDG
jgi:predicted ribonuclease YlaK